MENLAGKRIATYLRFSSDNQREASLEDQLRRNKEYADRHGGVVDDRLIFSDAAMSGATMDRPGIQRLCAAVEAGEIDALVVEDMSRISRDQLDALVFYKRLQWHKVLLLGVLDGTNTAAEGAEIQFTFNSLANEKYLKDLSFRTRRGQEGRWLKGLSTGSPPLGYTSKAVLGPDGKAVGYQTIIDAETAAIVRRIFSLYDDGYSLAAIAKTLNDDGVKSPRAKTKHEWRGWGTSTVREILANEAYIGRWSWRKREWVRLPFAGPNGKRKRRSRKRPESEVQQKKCPELRIIDQELWTRVRKRAAKVSAKYKGRSTGTAPGSRTVYPLSGLLHCAACGAPMIISRGTSAGYYACADHRKRGTCKNGKSVREDAARRTIFDVLRRELFTPEAVEYLRKKIAERLGEMGRTSTEELRDRAGRLERTEGRIRRLVHFIAEGDDSKAIRSTLKDLEAHADAERTAIQNLREQASSPVTLPTSEAIISRAQDLDRVYRADPTVVREKLRRVFKDGRILLHLQPDGTYVAEGTFLPMIALAEMTKPPTEKPGARCPAISCAGRI